MFVRSHGSAVLGIDALPIAAEVNITAGIGMYLVGLPDNAVRESQERIRAAFENCSYKMSGKKVVVNLSPADIRKEGSAYDLTIALGILAATEQLPAERLSRYIVMGELSLDGSVLPVRGALPMALAARAAQQARFAGLPIHCNASMGSKQIRAFCPLPAESETMLRRAMEHMHLSARAYDRIVKVARTIADLAGETRIAPAHIAEAIRYRSLDRESAG